jgi:antitoxin MazE
MKTPLKRRGNSAAERIVIEPVRQKQFELRKLLKRITPKKQHELVDFGPAIGKESW